MTLGSADLFAQKELNYQVLNLVLSAEQVFGKKDEQFARGTLV